MVLTQEPHVCERGYESTDTRPPQDGSNRPMNEDARCAEPPTESNARGAQNINRAGAAYRAPVVASYDPESGRLSWGDKVDPALASPGRAAPQTLGEESWKWLFLQPLTRPQE
jgi:phospholipid/cholesterol/gamma-HCH transport system substrate-binding protein